jgi:hypothetical protein
MQFGLAAQSLSSYASTNVGPKKGIKRDSLRTSNKSFCKSVAGPTSILSASASWNSSQRVAANPSKAKPVNFRRGAASRPRHGGENILIKPVDL